MNIRGARPVPKADSQALRDAMQKKIIDGMRERQVKQDQLKAEARKRVVFNGGSGQ